MASPAELEALKAEILSLTRRYAASAHRAFRPAGDPLRPAFDSKGGSIPYAGRVFTEDEVEAAVSSTLDFWLTLGNEGEAFQKELAGFLGVRACLAVNSGSSANLLALSALTSHLLPATKRLQPGDEVITCAAGFPTTVTPILQNGCIPVFIDNDPLTGNLEVDQLEAAFVPGRTKAVMAAHALGNPFDLGGVLSFCRQHDLWLIEDNCDALGCSYTMPRDQAEELGFNQNSPGLDAGDSHVIRWSGTWGDISTQSFYPPHHLTMGEGGAVNIVKSSLLRRIVESFRDWGRDCWCPSGRDDTCSKRYDWQLGELPKGYDHKYIYSHFGYNLKPLDPQAAIGRIQIRRLPEFIEIRKRNWQRLREGLDHLSDVFNFCLPTHATNFDTSSGSFSWDSSGAKTDCSWFGFLLLVRREAPFTSSELGRHLASKGVGTRMLFGGNLLKQPAFVQLIKDRPDAMRLAVDEMPGADQLMQEALFLGTYPGLSEEMIDRELALISAFVEEKKYNISQPNTAIS